MEIIKKVMTDFSIAFMPKLLPQLEDVKTYICSYPLFNRVTTHWKVLLMDCSTILSITCFVITFIHGATFFCVIFAIVSTSSAVAAFYMRRFEELQDLETTTKKLKETKEKFETLATNLERENHRLSQTNRELSRTNEAFQTTHRELQTTNQAFRTTNAQLVQQVTELTLQVTQLRESAERIRGEVARFQQENAQLGTQVTGFEQSLHVLDQQITASRDLCAQISNHLASQQQGLGEQLTQLSQYLAELRTQDSVHQRIQELTTLHQQVLLATHQLHTLQQQYTEERSHFEAVHNALVQLRNQFDTTLQNAASSYANNNQQFREGISALAAERERIQNLLNHYFPTRTAPQGNHPVSFAMRTGGSLISVEN